MGVKYLWTILAPFCDRKPLYELQGKTVAVDLSCWICEAQNIAEYQVQPRMYLRNLYFRTCYLLLMDVNPVFVLEGKAPELKYDTISARNAIQFKGAKPKTGGVKTGKDRTRFHFVLRQCEEMLSYMGIACIKGNGEAESLCAYLNEDGLVDGCISQDSDCFAYGAQVVYRNFSISTQGTQSASGGAVDVYDIKKANQSLNFGRNKIVAMALLIGSDYSEGIHGVGKESVLKFFETVSNDEVLDRLRSWRNNGNMYETYEKQLNDKNICTSCGHTGKIQSHTKNGCNPCKTTKGCDPFKYKNERLNIKNEVNIRNKAMQNPNFPDEVLIKEFLHRKDNVTKLDLTWKQPNVVKFLKFASKFLQWEELYSFEKILPVLARWQCRNPELLKTEEKLKGVIKPEKIRKVRNPKGVPSYEIIWSDPSGCFKGLIPDQQLLDNKVDLEKLWSTIEPQLLVKNTYPKLVEDFEQSKIKPKKISKRKKKVEENIAGLSEKLKNVSISVPKVRKNKKPKLPKGQQDIDNVISTNIANLNENNLDDLNLSLKRLTVKDLNLEAQKTEEGHSDDPEVKQTTSYKQKTHSKNKTKTLESFVKKIGDKGAEEKLTQHTFSTPIKPSKNDLPFDLDMSAFGDESDLDLSDIIDDIVSNKQAACDLKRIADKYVVSHEVICLEDSLDDSDENIANMNDKDIGDSNFETSFFMKNIGDVNDLFEKTFNETFRNFGSSGSDTEEYDFNDKASKNNFFTDDCGKTNVSGNVEYLSSDDDSFCVTKYVPLYERVKLSNNS